MINRIGIYYAYWAKNWSTDVFSYPRRAKTLGFDILELKLSLITQMSERERNDLKLEAQEHAVELTFCDALTENIDISSPNYVTRKHGIEYIKRGLDAIHKLGGNILGGILYGAWNPPAEEWLNKQDRLKWSVESMRQIIKTAEDLGIIIAIEAVNRYEHFLINTCAEALNYINMVESPNIKIMLDTFHMNIEEDSIYNAILLAGKDLGHLHIGETNRKPPGRGRFPWSELVRALRIIEYPGRIVMEPFVQVGGDIGRDIRVWRNLAEDWDLDKEAQEALLFVRALLSQPHL